ncbi:MAG: transglutaminaseTgpA domain-containing protein [Bifidobacterium sp.]|nr:transglutaminaseTgpA domain-containing protein [Bifidobacterium sp.]
MSRRDHRPIPGAASAPASADGAAAASSARAVPDPSFTSTGTGTGTWAEAAHSVIRMADTSMGSTRRGVPGMQWRATAVSAVVLALVTLLGASGLIPVYGTLATWAYAAVMAAVIGALIVVAGAFAPLRIWWQLAFLVIAQWVVGPVLCCNGTTFGHVLPTLETLREGWTATFGSFKVLIAIAPPVGSTDGSLMAVWTIVLWVTAIAGFLGTMPNGRFSALSTLLVMAEFAACALLGTDAGWHPAITGLVAMGALVVWMAWRWGTLEPGRWAASAVILVLAAAVAFGGCLLAPQDRTTLRDHYTPPLSPYDYSSPLSGMRAYLKDYGDKTLLTVRNLPAGTPVRLAVMDRFDGNVWNLSDSREASDSSNYVRVGTRIDQGDVTGKAFTAEYTVHEGLTDDWLPLAGDATSVSFDPSSLDSSFYYNTGTDTGLLNGGLKKGLTYTETGVVPAVPSDAKIAEAKSSTVTQPAADDVPEAVSKLATAIAGGQSGGAAAQALAARLRDDGWFSNGLADDYPSLPGHGNYRLTKMLAGTAMVGDSEQYASAMALMARELGLSSRVVLGFLPKDRDGSIDASRTKKDGDGTVVEFTGNDVTAWVEVKLAGLGWTAFYPTPKETKVPTDSQDLTPPNPQTLVKQPPMPLTDPLRDEQNTTGQSSVGGDDAGDGTRDARWTRVAKVAKAVVIYGSPLWIVLIVVGIILLIKALQLRYVRRHGRAQLRVGAGWQAVANLARQSGVAVHGTRAEQCAQIAGQLGVDGAALAAAGDEADRAAFSGEPVPEARAHDYWRRVDGLRAAMLASLPRWRRLRTRLSLRGVLHPSVREPGSGRARTHHRKDRG